MRTVLLIAVSWCTAAWAQAPQDGGAWISVSEWRWHEGDDPRWAEADFDDSGWQQRPEISMTRNRLSRHGWSRTCIEVPEAWRSKPLAVALGILRYQTGAIEVYVNGIRVGTRGQMPAPERNGRTYINRHEAFVIPVEALRGSRACLAIHTWTRRGLEQWPYVHEPGSAR